MLTSVAIIRRVALWNGATMAGYVVSAVPLVILLAFMMRACIDGLTSGAGKL